DLILMDVMMPVMDGYAFRSEQLKNPKWDSIPVLAMSAQDQREEKLRDFGIAHFISKPLELEHLLHVVRCLS
ncbi:MAG: response regulator, partial [Bacteriovorax sp.]